ncbi:hypothetical protein N0V88_002687 [Collariella sp. IMI 366227]|nr:hypothetical protein N0V88_002687 [Collariella sp. IMI 366227]
MCGRYAMALRPSQVRQMLQDDNMPVYDAPADEGDGAPRQSFNFAPTNHGVVYRAAVPERPTGTAAGAGTAHGHSHGNAEPLSHEKAASEENQQPSLSQPQTETQTQTSTTSTTQPQHDHHNPFSGRTPSPSTPHYILQSMKWGLIPSWAKRTTPHYRYAAALKTINCRADSLASSGGLWASMKHNKRCVVVAQGFYEWLKTGPGGKERVPYYESDRKGGGEGGEGGKLYTYTVITTDSNAQLKFLHDRMPVIFEPNSEPLWTWLDPARNQWSKELQAVLKPYGGELEVYPVSKEVGKVGNDSPTFVVPVASKENKGNIANFFANAIAKRKGKEKVTGGDQAEVEVEKEGEKAVKTVEELEEEESADGGMGTPKKGVKRGASGTPVKGQPQAKKAIKNASPVKQARGKISATSNVGKSPVKGKAKAEGSQKITKFFGNST